MNYNYIPFELEHYAYKEDEEPVNKYLNGKIYKIVAFETEDVYIGSTVTSLKQRYSVHKSVFKAWVNTKNKYCSSAHMFLRHGLDNCKIELIENCICYNKKELEGREAHFIEEYANTCVNSNKPGRSQAQWILDNKDKIAQYRVDNKDRLDHYHAQYRNDNKAKILVHSKVKQNCECGGNYTNVNKCQHIKTKKHQKYINK